MDLFESLLHRCSVRSFAPGDVAGLAAHGLGYGSSFQTTFFLEAAVLAHFGVPDCYSLICVLPIGRPDKMPPRSPRSRLDPVIWEDSYPGRGAPAAEPSQASRAADLGPLVEILYSPACPVNAHFVAAAREWLGPFLVSGQVRVDEVRTDRAPERAASLLGLKDLSQLQHNVFITVFVDGREVSSVPLNPDAVRNGVRNAQGLPPIPERGPAAWWGPVQHRPRTIRTGDLRFELLTRDNFDSSLELCLCRHPAGGLTPAEHHVPGRLMKLEWLETVWAEVPAVGVVALDGGSPVGLIEAYPRPTARSGGFVTGRGSPDEETLTVTCIEVAGGCPRLEVIDALMSNLVRIYEGGLGRYRWIDGLGVFGQTTGTNPYWVFEKYGFRRIQDVVPGKRALLRRHL